MAPHHTIELPALPNAWNRLSQKELEEVNRLSAIRMSEISTKGAAVATRLFKLRCFLYFLHLKVRRKIQTQKGETVFLFRRTGIRYLFENIPLTAWQVNQHIDRSLNFLDVMEERTVSPYGTVRLFGKVFKGPKDLLTNVTHHQYSTAQNLLIRYWDSIGVIDVLLKEKRKQRSIRIAEKKLREIQCKFLAVLFNASSIQTEVRTATTTRKVRRKVFVYDSDQIKNWKYFRFAYKRMFPVMLQYFQSVQVYYSKIFPELFTPKGNKTKHHNYLVMEVNSMNQIMKFAGFSKYQDIYESGAVFILGVLNDMTKYAQSIEEMNARLKSKR